MRLKNARSNLSKLKHFKMPLLHNTEKRLIYRKLESKWLNYSMGLGILKELNLTSYRSIFNSFKILSITPNSKSKMKKLPKSSTPIFSLSLTNPSV